MALTQLILQNFFSFVFLISFIVFIHEFGHFLVARLCGVKIEEFSIGFGRELFGFYDKKNTRWKICPFPFGGYVKMYGDKNGASMPDAEAIALMSEAEKKISFIGKNVAQRIAIVSAGPIANFLLAIFIFTFLFQLNGLVTTPAVIGEVTENSAASQAGLKKGDKILSINEKEIQTFDQIREVVSISADKKLQFKILRNSEIISVEATPQVRASKDIFGDEVKVAMLGVAASESLHQDLNIAQSFVAANKETYRISIAIFKATAELITGKRSVAELGGPIKIAKYTGKTVEMGFLMVLWFVAMISINLGVMNLLPVPVLDGGHLFYYLIELIFRKPLPQKAQKIGFQVGLSLILTLMIFTTFNDIKNLIFGS
ncbi:MAG: RIP metalloprotease RseP [Proteobacteria bacterium]|nr:RIP metalloprotease RseP [Pseudomonadota bacterium]